MTTFREDLGKAFASRDGNPGDNSEANPGLNGQEPPNEDASGNTDPLAGLELDDLLKHPELGSKLNSWKDKAASREAQTAVDRARPSIEAQAAQRKQDELMTNYFSNLEQEELARILASDTDIAAEYGRLQEQAKHAPNPDENSTTALYHAYTLQVAQVNRTLNESGLSAEIKAGLDPNKFTHLGPEGIVEWSKAVNQAIIQEEVAKTLKAEFDSKWEAEKQDRLAKEEEESGGTRGKLVPPSRNGGPPDLLGTDNSTLFHSALEGRARQRGNG